MKSHCFEAIGTHWEIRSTAREDLLARIHARIETFDRNYSRFRSDSLISFIARGGGEHQMPDDFAPLWEIYVKLNSLTEGMFTPLVGAVLEDLGYDSRYSFKESEPRPLIAFSALSYDGEVLSVPAPALLDFGAAGKGYLIDIIATVLIESGVDTFMINAGGDILSHGAMLRVGLEDPDDQTKVVGVMEIRDESICASAGNRRRWGSHHHIINPKTRTSVDAISATWVAADNALTADALSTALYFAEPEVLAEEFDFEWLLLQPDRSARYSSRFSNALLAA